MLSLYLSWHSNIAYHSIKSNKRSKLKLVSCPARMRRPNRWNMVLQAPLWIHPSIQSDFKLISGFWSKMSLLLYSWFHSVSSHPPPPSSWVLLSLIFFITHLSEIDFQLNILGAHNFVDWSLAMEPIIDIPNKNKGTSVRVSESFFLIKLWIITPHEQCAMMLS